MTDERKLNIIFYTGGLIITCIVLLVFQTPITLVSGLFLAALLGITHGFTQKPHFGFQVIIAMSAVLAFVGIFWGIAPSTNMNFHMFLFGLGGIFGSVYTLMLDDVRNSIVTYLNS